MMTGRFKEGGENKLSWNYLIILVMYIASYKIKYTERISEFKRRSYSDEDKKKWEKVLTPELAISSDESGTEDGKGVIFCEKIPW